MNSDIVVMPLVLSVDTMTTVFTDLTNLLEIESCPSVCPLYSASSEARVPPGKVHIGKLILRLQNMKQTGQDPYILCFTKGIIICLT